MKNKASVVLKHIISWLSSIGKAKSRITRTAKARLVMLSLMTKSKKVLIMDSLSHKVHNLLRNRHSEDEEEYNVEDLSKAVVLYNARANDHDYVYYDDDDGEKYPDLRHSLFDEFDEDDQDLQGGSVIDLVRNSKEEGEDFSLEDEIDRVADLFITRFHKQMRLQKLESFKRYQEMLQRGL
ncbi:hypothetical protein L484_017208 [Morus notabilis]|uniref:DUF761 domain-containing protein n=1 Tax=Morus notabilis TaxID=981085 RepID=W9R608_9ROSA|nr:uncharacterized protein LOC21400214 [Morus notabilis]EXB55297.1 hypothetical protein L484_017208 [Morus notabilis]